MFRAFPINVPAADVERFVDTINNDPEAAARWVLKMAETDLGTGGIGTWWAPSLNQIEYLYGQGGWLKWRDGKVAYDEWNVYDSMIVRVTVEATPQDKPVFQNTNFADGTPFIVTRVMVWALDHGYVHLGGAGLRTTAKMAVERLPYQVRSTMPPLGPGQRRASVIRGLQSAPREDGGGHDAEHAGPGVREPVTRRGAGAHRSGGRPGLATVGGVGPGPGGIRRLAAPVKITVSRDAQQRYNSLPGNVRPLVLRAVKSLGQTTTPVGVKGLTAKLSGFMSLRVTAPGGEYRVIYKIVSSTYVQVVYVGPRENFYEEAIRAINRMR